MKIAYLDCFSGISGDMLVGALLDAGLALEALKKALETLPLKGYSLDARPVEKNHLRGTQFTVNVDEGQHGHRGLKEIREILTAGKLPREVEEKSLEVFEAIAREEGKIHGRPPEEVHFHEVGVVDSIIDIVGTVLGIALLEIDAVHASALPLGSGFVKTGHGRIPIPAPATVALLKDVPVYDSGLKSELVTPTGAALVTALARSFGTMPSMTVQGVGYGAGSRDLPDRPNLLRILIGRASSRGDVETVVLLEANLDDANPEWLGFLMDRLFEQGALDVLFCPVQMKKNRPGILVQVMGHPHQKDGLMDTLFRETTTLGVRFRESRRRVLKRTEAEIDSPWGSLKVKKVFGPDGAPFLQPEFDVCRDIAVKNGIPVREVYHWVMSKNISRSTRQKREA